MPSMGRAGLSFALFCVHGPLSGTWWNPQLDSSRALCGAACTRLLSHGALQLSVLYRLWLSLIQGALGAVSPQTLYCSSWSPQQGGLVGWLFQGCLIRTLLLPRLQSLSGACSFYR